MFLFFLFIAGLCLGSFLNVVIDRWPDNKSIVSGRSHCDFCKRRLSVLDLIPVISFLLLQGKCRYCHKKLSRQYPVVELATGFLLVTSYIFSSNLPLNINLQQFNNLTIPFSSDLLITVRNSLLLAMSLYFIVIFVVDLKYEIILERVINSAIVFTILIHLSLLAILQFNSLAIKYLIIYYFTGLIVALFFRFLIFVSRGRGLGEGDIKLGFWLGLLLGFPNIIPGMFIAFVSGGIIGLFLVVTKIKKFGQTVPLAPFLVTGSYIAYFFGAQIINWYLKTFIGY